MNNSISYLLKNSNERDPDFIGPPSWRDYLMELSCVDIKDANGRYKTAHQILKELSDLFNNY